MLIQQPRLRLGAWVLVWVGWGLYLNDFINQYAVNFLFSDLWAMYVPLFKEEIRLAEVFFSQPVPHYQGVGNLVEWGIKEWAQFNTIWDSRVVLMILLGCAVLGLWLKYRLTQHLSWWDLVIPAIFLRLNSYESLVITPNTAHAAFPIFFLMAIAVAFSFKSSWGRNGILLALQFLIVYAGYGFLMVIVMPALWALLTWSDFVSKSESRWQTGVTFVVSVILSSLVLNYYIWGIDEGCPLVLKLYRYFFFSMIMMTGALGVVSFHKVALALKVLVLGVPLISILTWSAYQHLIKPWRSVRSDSPLPTIYLLLFGFPLAFSLVAATGRFCISDLGGAVSSRYVIMMIPVIYGVYLLLAQWADTKVAVVWKSGYAILVIGSSLYLTPKQVAINEYFSEKKQAWRDCYLEHHDLQHCNESLEFEIHPSSDVQSYLDFIEKHQLNFFSEVAR